MVYVLLAIRWLLALLFVTSGASKVTDRDGLAAVIDRYAVVPTRYTLGLATALPRLEIALGLVLAVGLLPGVASLCASFAFLAFAAAVAVNLKRGRRFDCGCGGVIQREIGWSLVVRNIILAAVAGIVAIGPAGLAIWTAGLAGGNVHTSARDLLAVPLVVIAAAAAAQCTRTYRAATRAADIASDLRTTTLLN